MQFYIRTKKQSDERSGRRNCLENACVAGNSKGDTAQGIAAHFHRLVLEYRKTRLVAEKFGEAAQMGLVKNLEQTKVAGVAPENAGDVFAMLCLKLQNAPSIGRGNEQKNFLFITFLT